MSIPYIPGLTAESFAVVIDTNGRRITGDVTIELLPGNGISGPTGEHLDSTNGPHTVPVAFALPLIQARRARVVQSSPAPEAPTAEAQPVGGAPDGVEQRDPVPESRESRRKGKR